MVISTFCLSYTVMEKPQHIVTIDCVTHRCDVEEKRFALRQQLRLLAIIHSYGIHFSWDSSTHINDKVILNHLTLEQAIAAVSAIPIYHAPECKQCRPNLYRGTMMRELWIRENAFHEKLTKNHFSWEILAGTNASAEEEPNARTNERTKPRARARSSRGKKVFH
jgi:hypothetical protein